MNVTTDFDARLSLRGRTRAVLCTLYLVLAIVFIGTSTIGSVPISAGEVATLPLRKLGLVATTAHALDHDAVLVSIRFPRLVLGTLIGAALALSGVGMQGLFRNPLADPALLGISSGAALFAVSTIAMAPLFESVVPSAILPYVLPVAAFLGAVLAMLFVQSIGRREGRTSITLLLLGGIAVNAIAQALMGLVVYSADDAQLRNITFWNLGSVGATTWSTVLGSAPFLLVPVFVLPRFGRPLDAIVLGEAEASHLGGAVERVKRRVFAVVALGVGASVAAAGILGFVGLVVPHLLRLALGPRHRTLLFAAAPAGSSLLLLADAFARTVVAPAELPLGIVTATIGTPFFLALLLRERKLLS